MIYSQLHLMSHFGFIKSKRIAEQHERVLEFKNVLKVANLEIFLWNKLEKRQRTV